MVPVLGTVLAKGKHTAMVYGQHPDHAVDQGCLARAILTDQAKHVLTLGEKGNAV